jgi:HEAT repeat protein
MNLLNVVLWIAGVLTLLSLLLLIATILLRMVTDRHLAGDASFRQIAKPLIRSFLTDGADIATVALTLRKDPRAGMQLLMEESESLGTGGRDKLKPLLGALPYAKNEMKHLKDRHWERRLHAAEALGYLGDETSLPSLMSALRDDLMDVRFAAAESLARLGCQQAVEPILSSLDVGGDVSQRRLAEIITILGASATDPILAILQDPSSTENSLGIAARVAGSLRIHRAIDPLQKLLNHTSQNVRLNAVRSLSSIASTASQSDHGVITAIASLSDDSSWEVRCMVMKSLGKLRATHEIPLLLQGLSDPQWWVRHNAADALYSLGEPGITALRDSVEGHVDGYGRDVSREILQQHGILKHSFDQRP